VTLLVVTAVEPEAAAVRAGLPAGADVAVYAVGVGPAESAAATARLLARTPYRGVVCTGVGGGFAGRAAIGDIVVATRSVAADLGAEDGDRFIPLDVLGFGAVSRDADPGLVDLPGARTGAILTVTTATGSAATAAALLARHPDAVAEGMEGYGVACAAAGASVPFAEVRAVSNAIGPRDRAAWRIPDALAALTAAAAGFG
jgi:futalosine hydrolase